MRLERMVVNLRWVAAITILGEALYMGQGSGQPVWYLFSAPLFLILYNAASFLVVTKVRLNRRRLYTLAAITTACDIIAVTALVVGAASSIPEVYLGYVFVIISAALRLNIVGSVATGVALSVAFSTAIMVTVPVADQPSVQVLVGRALFFIVLSFGMGVVARQLSQEREKREELATLYEASRAAAATLDLDDLLQLFVRSAVRQLGAKAGAVFLIDRTRHVLRLRASEGLEEDVAAKAFYKIGEGNIGWVAETGLSLLVQNGVRDPGVPKPSGEDYFPSVLAVPLIAKGIVSGVFGLGERLNGEDYTGSDLRLVATLAGQASSSIENIRLYDNLEQLVLNTMKALAAAIDAKDPYTRGHSDRVADYSLRLAERLDIRGNELDIFHYAGILHDIGKIAIEDAILRKEGPLTPD
jgi:HD-GYP domain-containing protein (c-di-GMP phosphodiesterase class II)